MITFAPGQEGRALRSVEEIAASYDAQAEASLQTKRENPFFERYGRAVGQALKWLAPTSLLDVGTGDGYTLRYALEEVDVLAVVAVDCSGERLRYAASMLGPKGVTLHRADLFHLPFGDESFDVVMTSHAIEPNGGREREAVRELYRVARRYILMLEPDYGRAPSAGKARMERLGYITQLWDAMSDSAHPNDTLTSQAFITGNPLNPTGAFLIRKDGRA